MSNRDLIAAARERALTDSPAHALINELADALQSAEAERNNIRAVTAEQVRAWEAVAGHPFFRECFEAEDTLTAAMLRKLDAAHSKAN